MRLEYHIAAAYLLFGICWILFSDLLLAAIADEPGHIVVGQIIKGCFFVATSAVVIFLIARRAAKKLREKEEARERELKALLSEVHHIVLNYLNQMQLVTLEAETCKNFNPETLRLAKEISKETAEELKKLGAEVLSQKAPEDTEAKKPSS